MRYSIKAAARAAGVSEGRLRTWERRYGVPTPARSETGRRLYDDQDLLVIRRMASLVDAGLSAAEAAEAARSDAPLPERPEEEPPAHPAVARITEASARFDEEATVGALREAVTEHGWGVALDLVAFPALDRIGKLWGANSLVSANEHFTSEIVRREIAAALAQAATGDRGVRIVLACPEDERHELGLLGLALLLRLTGLRTVYLGGDVPTGDLLWTLRETEAAAVCLSATTRSGLASLGRATRLIVDSDVRARVFVGGPAFERSADAESIAGIRLPHRLSDAADAIVNAMLSGS